MPDAGFDQKKFTHSLKGHANMFPRSVLLSVIVSLAVSGGARAYDVFVDVNANSSISGSDLSAYPTGVSAGGACVLQGARDSGANYYDVCYYSGSAGGTMTSMNSTLTAGTLAFGMSVGGDMNDQGDFTSTVVTQSPQVQWLTTNHGTNTTYDANVPSGSGQALHGIGIDSNDDICGTYTTGSGTSAGYSPCISINNGSGGFTTYTPAATSTYGTFVTAMTTPTTVGSVTSGLAVGYAEVQGGIGPPVDHPAVWSYSITGGAMTSTLTDLMGGTGSTPLSSAFPGATAAAAVAINSSGLAVIAAMNNGTEGPVEYCQGALLYNTNTQTFTPLTQGSTSLLITDSMTHTISWGAGHDQAIDNAGQVVGYIGTSGSTWQAAMWQNGVITNLNAEYAGILPAGVVLNNATAIDNNGDIAGDCTVDGTPMQAFVIYAPTLGDANLDNRVDVNDLTIVLANYDRSGMAWTQGEFTGHGTVDINDLTIVLAHYGQTLGAAGGAGFSAVPEPGSLLLVILAAGAAGLLACVWRRRR
jgi:probable HAF family extracellular repeat protein